jgi:hypothetical protein
MNIDFTRGELVGAARALLLVYMRVMASKAGSEARENFYDILKDHERELKRLVNNAFQFPSNDLGDPVQFALTILLMNGEDHAASGRHTK